MEPVIQLRGVTKTYRGADAPAVDGVDLTIDAGEIVAVLGPNGAGKTTTLDMVLGFIRPSAGSIRVFGGSPTDALHRGRVSAVLQTGGLLRDLRVGETLELVASLYDNPPSIASVAERAGLDALLGRKVQGCSGGEQQRLRFALALLADPDLLILDEPTAGMDVEARQQFWASMREEAAEGRTVVFATHYLQEAEDFAERTVVLANGRIVADGPTDVIRRRGSGRRLSARIPATTVDACLRVLNDHPAVHAITGGDAGATGATTFGSGATTGDERSADQRIEIESSDSDEIARLLLVEFGGSDLEIAVVSLEMAFINLTTDRPDTSIGEVETTDDQARSHS